MRVARGVFPGSIHRPRKRSQNLLDASRSIQVWHPGGRILCLTRTKCAFGGLDCRQCGPICRRDDQGHRVQCDVLSPMPGLCCGKASLPSSMTMPFRPWRGGGRLCSDGVGSNLADRCCGNRQAGFRTGHDAAQNMALGPLRSRSDGFAKRRRPAGRDRECIQQNIGYVGNGDRHHHLVRDGIRCLRRNSVVAEHDMEGRAERDVAVTPRARACREPRGEFAALFLAATAGVRTAAASVSTAAAGGSTAAASVTTAAAGVSTAAAVVPGSAPPLPVSAPPLPCQHRRCRCRHRRCRSCRGCHRRCRCPHRCRRCRCRGAAPPRRMLPLPWSPPPPLRTTPLSHRRHCAAASIVNADPASAVVAVRRGARLHSILPERY